MRRGFEATGHWDYAAQRIVNDKVMNKLVKKFEDRDDARERALKKARTEGPKAEPPHMVAEREAGKPLDEFGQQDLVDTTLA